MIASTAFAQTKQDKYEKSRQEVLAKATHIFEGIVVPYTKTEIHHATSGYPIDKINVVVNKIFRGKYYSLGDTITVTHYSPFSRSMPNWGGVFFCEKEKNFAVDSKIYKITSGGAYITLNDYTSKSEIKDTTQPELAGYYAHGFLTREAFYNYLAKQKNIKIRVASPKPSVKRVAQVSKEDSIRMEQEQAKRSEEWMNKLLERTRRGDSLNNVQKKSLMRSAKSDQIMAGGNLNIYLANQTTTVDGSGNRYLEFDINF